MNTSPTNPESSTEPDAGTSAGPGSATGPGSSAGSPADSAGPTDTFGQTGPTDSAGPADSTGPSDSSPLATGFAGFGGSHGQRGLSRSVDDRMVAGVAAGIARYIDVDVNLVRIAFGVLVFFGGVGVAIYLAGWLLIPEDGTDRSIASDLVESLENHAR